ncbi:MAG: hypothetical protein HYZ29_03350 [Myxococcales bacterium]|nr:hypothetical protein [Myxococcales bacterium]
MRPTVGLLVVVSALVACKMFKKEEPAPSALPPSEPAPTAAATATESAAPTAESSAASPPTGTPTVTTKKGDAGAKDAGASDASASSDAGAKSDAGGGKGAACASKCQSVLQTCLLPSATEGGLPKLADPQKCQAAFDECAKACK